MGGSEQSYIERQAVRRLGFPIPMGGSETIPLNQCTIT